MASPQSYIGQHLSALPTPSLILSKPTIEKNIAQLHQDVKDLGIAFRPHIKTLKSLEITRLMLANGAHRKLVASTLPEIEGSLPLVQEGILDEILYGIPIYPSVLRRLHKVSQSVRIALMIDNEAHVDILEKFAITAGVTKPWPVFIKIDVGTRRAGVVQSSSALPSLVKRVEGSDAVELGGFYCHAGHSYSCRSEESAVGVLKDELDGVISASKHLSSDQKVLITIGSTPTAHVVKELKESLPANLELELHAGNFPCNDLQQLSTGLIPSTAQSVRVLAEVCSVYPERNEALINAGTIALSKEASDFPGYGRVTDKPQWSVVRTSQEHGILGLSAAPALELLGVKGGKIDEGERVESVYKVGDQVLLWVQHACIAASAFGVYFVVDEEGIIRDVWVPWKWW
ncbi:putative serine dehydratase domain-containing protein [Aspergillus crustosus]